MQEGSIIKNVLIGLYESNKEGKFLFTKDAITDVKDVFYDKEQKCIRLDIENIYNKDVSILFKAEDFMKWLNSNKEKSANVFLDFVTDFMSDAKEDMTEVVDENGDLIGDADMPTNSTNSMVGSSNWDLNKLGFRGIPKNNTRYSGYLGYGSVVW
jgi:hypothetical protein